MCACHFAINLTGGWNSAWGPSGRMYFLWWLISLQSKGGWNLCDHFTSKFGSLCAQTGITVSTCVDIVILIDLLVHSFPAGRGKLCHVMNNAWLLSNVLHKFWLYYNDGSSVLTQTYEFWCWNSALVVELWVLLSSHWPPLLEHPALMFLAV